MGGILILKTLNHWGKIFFHHMGENIMVMKGLGEGNNSDQNNYQTITFFVPRKSNFYGHFQ